MPNQSILSIFPTSLRVMLCGKREYATRHDLRNISDPDWLAWQEVYLRFYADTQRKGLGSLVADWGYAIMRSCDLSGKACLEIGPGALAHTKFWKGKPTRYDLVDANASMLAMANTALRREGIPNANFLVDGVALPVADESYDMVLTFNSLEHLFGLRAYLDEYKRVLKPGGSIVGCIPTEGGLAWGLGRFLTSRRYVRKNFKFDYDKIIAWEHCNVAQEILEVLDATFGTGLSVFFPCRIRSVDMNLTVGFKYEKR